MPDHAGKPLTGFLIALGRSPELLRQFRESPDEVLAKRGLQELASILRPDATLHEIQAAVAAEHTEEGADPIVMFWILVA